MKKKKTMRINFFSILILLKLKITNSLLVLNNNKFSSNKNKDMIIILKQLIKKTEMIIIKWIINKNNIK